jgi:hypothetical protein
MKDAASCGVKPRLKKRLLLTSAGGAGNEIPMFGEMIAIILNTYNEKGGSKRLATYRQRRG